MQPLATGQPTNAGPAAETEPELATLLSVEDAAQRLSIGRTTMYTLLKDGQINSVRIGRLRRVPAEALTAYTARLAAVQNVA
jgi:excisionase family DNA binding protein